MGFISKLKAKFTGKGKSSKKGKDQKSTEERYGIPETGFQNNPLYEADQTEDHYGVEQVNPLFEEPQAEEQQNAEPAVPEGNLLNNIGGLPNVASIAFMAGEVHLDKIGRHKNFDQAIQALKAYQAIMSAPRSTTVNEVSMRHKGRYDAERGQIHIDKEAIAEARMKMADFVYYAGKAVKESGGIFASRSSNVRKLTPVFANMLVRAGDLLPKLAHLESAVAPYIIQTGQEGYTFSDVINHEVMGAHAGGLVMSGLEESNGVTTLSPDQLQQAVSAIRYKDDENDNDDENDKNDKDVLSELRTDRAEKVRMGLPIPVLPVGVLSEEKKAANGGEEIQILYDRADKIAERYIAELRPLMTALDDAAESYEFTQEKERKGVQDQKAKSFRISRLLYRVMNNKELLKQLIIEGALKEGEKPQGYKDMMQLYALGGESLSVAMERLNKIAGYGGDYTGLTDAEGKDLEVSTDYIVGGGAMSISILDHKNRRVLRAPKLKNGQYLSEEDQTTALNGIRDEAAGKVAQFLGFNVCAQAEAAGFKARDIEGKNETAVFGGSIMEMAKGVSGKDINLLMHSGDKGKILEDRRGDNYQTLDLTQNGKFIEDIMKMNVLDFLIQHNDRNTGNFLVDINPDKNGSMVTAIDNDMILGFDNQVRIGGVRSEDALLAINERALLDYGIRLAAACPMMTQDVKNAIERLDTEAFDRLLMPYADRLTRMTAVHRAKELKEWARKVPTCDLTTPEGVEKFLDVAKKESMKQWLRQMSAEGDNGSPLKSIPNTIMRMVIVTNTKLITSWGNETMTLQAFNALGFSKEEAEAMILENYSASIDSDEPITKEQLAQTRLGKALKEYDSFSHIKSLWREPKEEKI